MNNNALAVISRSGTAPAGSPQYTPVIGGTAASPTTPVTALLLATGFGHLFTRDLITRFFYYIDGAGNLWSWDSFNPSTPAVQMLTAAQLTSVNPGSIVAMRVGGDGNLYLATTSYAILKVLTSAPYTASVFAGNGTSGDADGTGTGATLNSIAAMDVDKVAGAYLIAWEGTTGSVRRITIPGGVVTTIKSGAGALQQHNGFTLSRNNLLVLPLAQQLQIMDLAAGTNTNVGARYPSTYIGPVALSSSGNFLYYFIGDGSNFMQLMRVQVAGNVTTGPICTLPYPATTGNEAYDQLDFGPLGIHVVDTQGNLYRILG